MKLRLLLVLLFLCLSLAMSADRAPKNCPFVWTPITSQRNFPTGFGVNIHFTDPQPGEVKMIAAAGFRWVRMDFKWDATERERGVYDFSAYERLLAALDQNHIRALFILDYGNSLYDGGTPPRSEAARQAFARWTVAAITKFSGHGIVWELYNEPNIKLFWPPQPNVDEYIALALTVGRAVRTAAPHEILIGPATSGIDFAFLESCIKAGLLDYWSAVSVHPYLRSDPENVANDYCRVREMIARYHNGPAIPIISSEWGYSSVWRGLNEDRQGQLLAREFLTNAANGIPISIWYDWHDDGINPAEPEHHFGLVQNALQSGREQIYESKPAYLAATTLLHLFDGYSFEKRIDVKNDGDYVLLFSKGNEVRIAAWTTTGSHRIEVPFARPSVSIMQHTGAIAGPFSSSQGSLSIEVSKAPLYFVIGGSAGSAR